MNENNNKPNPLEKTEALETAGQLNLTREETAPGKDIGPPGDTLFSTTVLPRIEGTVPNIRLIDESQKRYQVKEAIGEGGAGKISLVEDKDIHRLVALKQLKKEHNDKMMLMRFIDEIRTVGRLEHPNIVPIHDVGKDEKGQYYFVMKYIDGESLLSIIQKLKDGNRKYHKKYTFIYRIGVVIEILKAIEFAHFKGIIHRDIKPENILVGHHGEVTVMDWGISKPVKKTKSKKERSDLLKNLEDHSFDEGDLPEGVRVSQTLDNTAIGTPAYMAPEQVLGLSDIHDERTDVYNICALAYEFLSLRSYLKPKKSLPDLLMAVLHEKPVIPIFVKNRHQSAVPGDLAYFCVKGLEKDPEKRFQSIAEMQTMLQRILEGNNPVHCIYTLIKRFSNSFVHMANSYPISTILFFLLMFFFIATGIVSLIGMIV